MYKKPPLKTEYILYECMKNTYKTKYKSPKDVSKNSKIKS